jgi:hypothetical protein
LPLLDEGLAAAPAGAGVRMFVQGLAIQFNGPAVIFQIAEQPEGISIGKRIAAAVRTVTARTATQGDIVVNN